MPDTLQLQDLCITLPFLWNLSPQVVTWLAHSCPKVSSRERFSLTILYKISASSPRHTLPPTSISILPLLILHCVHHQLMLLICYFIWSLFPITMSLYLLSLLSSQMFAFSSGMYYKRAGLCFVQCSPQWLAWGLAWGEGGGSVNQMFVKWKKGRESRGGEGKGGLGRKEGRRTGIGTV